MLPLPLNPIYILMEMLMCVDFSIMPILMLCRLIGRLDLPLNIGEQPAHEYYIRAAHTPDYKHVSR
jgi:hypothetical protein